MWPGSSAALPLPLLQTHLTARKATHLVSVTSTRYLFIYLFPPVFFSDARAGSEQGRRNKLAGVFCPISRRVRLPGTGIRRASRSLNLLRDYSPHTLLHTEISLYGYHRRCSVISTRSHTPRPDGSPCRKSTSRTSPERSGRCVAKICRCVHDTNLELRKLKAFGTNIDLHLSLTPLAVARLSLSNSGKSSSVEFLLH